MSADRVKRLKRLARVQARREAVAERVVLSAERRLKGLEAEKAALVRALSDSRTPHADVVIPVAAARLGRLEPRLDAARRRRDDAAAARRREARKRKAVETRAAAEERRLQDGRERAELEAVALLHLLLDDSLG